MLGAAETPYDLRFRFLGDTRPHSSLFWLVIGGAGMGRTDNLPHGGCLGGVRFRLDPGP